MAEDNTHFLNKQQHYSSAGDNISASGKGRRCTPVQLPQPLPSKMHLLAIFNSKLQYLTQTGHGERKSLGPALCPQHRRGWSKNPSLAAAAPSCRDSAGCRLRRIKELETADSIHMECTAHLSYMQEKALMTPNEFADIKAPHST